MIRCLQAEDLPEILQLFNLLPEEHHGWAARIDEQWFQGELLGGRAVGFWQVGAGDTELRAMLFCRCQSEISEITFLMVHPESRGQGVMAPLMKHYLHEIASEKEIWLEVQEQNHAALSFYQKWGFTEVGRRPSYYPDGSSAVSLSRGPSD